MSIEYPWPTTDQPYRLPFVPAEPVNPYPGILPGYYFGRDMPYTLQPLPQFSLPPTQPVPDRDPVLYFTIGTPRSGKSTLAKRWLRREASLAGEADDGFPRYLWDTDHLRLELYGTRHKFCGEPMVYAVKHYAVATALRAGHDTLACGTHTTRTSIRRILEIRRDAVPVIVNTPKHVCIQRANDTGQADLVNVIERTHDQLTELLDQGVANVIAGILKDIDNRVPY